MRPHTDKLLIPRLTVVSWSIFTFNSFHRLCTFTYYFRVGFARETVRHSNKDLSPCRRRPLSYPPHPRPHRPPHPPQREEEAAPPVQRRRRLLRLTPSPSSRGSLMTSRPNSEFLSARRSPHRTTATTTTTTRVMIM